MIKVKNLSKKFGNVTAVQDLSFHIQKGNIWGFVGPNGAGKTTTLRMLSGLLLPDGGTAEIAGIDVLQQPQHLHSQIGFMPDFFVLGRSNLFLPFIYFLSPISGLGFDI